MLSVSSLIEFLLSLLRDDDARAGFDQDPEGTLVRNGLDGVTAQDVRDVAPLLADRDGVSARQAVDRVSAAGRDSHHVAEYRSVEHRGADRDQATVTHAGDHHDGGWSRPDDDPVREIHQVTNLYHAEPAAVVHNNVYNEYTVIYEDNRVIDDRDVNVEGDGNTVAFDSYNQDNDGVDNKGGEITDSVVAGGDVSDSGNDNDGIDNDGLIVDSLNEDNSQTSTDTVIDGSFNSGDSEPTALDAASTEVSGEDSFTAIPDDRLAIDVTGRDTAENDAGQGDVGDDGMSPAHEAA